MIKYLNIRNHKALVHAQMAELGSLNIICGKNNSGKTTVLEALCNKNCYGVGKKVDSVDWLVKLFEPQAKRYSNPQPGNSIRWFSQYIKSLVEEETIWFSNAQEDIIEHIRMSQKKDPYLSSYRADIFNFNEILDKFFSKANAYFSPVLIPPKRQLEFRSRIDLNQEITPSGGGIINNLFFLKNQDLGSDDYKVYTRIYETFYEITGSKFNVVPNKNNQIELLYNTDGEWVPAVDSGLGLSDVLIIVTLFNVLNNNIFLLEEPENHLHADYQKRLLKYMSTIKSKQFFVTTHSSVFLDTNIVDKIFYCTNDGEIRLSDQTSKAEIISSLGYSVTENLVADLIVLVEGPTDIPVIQEMLRWFDVSGTYNIKFWPLGGDIMSSLDLSVFAERNNVFALIDSDPGSSVQRTRFLRNCKKNGIYCKKLERYSIENYFPIRAIRKTFPRQIPARIKKISPMKSVDAQIGFKEKHKTVKIKNSQIVKNMKIADIEGTDLYDFLVDIKTFLRKKDLSSLKK